MTNWYEDPVYIKMCDCPEILCNEEKKQIVLIEVPE